MLTLPINPNFFMKFLYNLSQFSKQKRGGLLIIKVRKYESVCIMRYSEVGVQIKGVKENEKIIY